MPNIDENIENIEYIYDFMILYEESYAVNGYEVLQYEFEKPILHYCLRKL